MAASSPPVPALISTNASLESLGSLSTNSFSKNSSREFFILLFGLLHSQNIDQRYHTTEEIYNYLDSLYEPSGVIDNAIVIIYTAHDSYVFEYDPNEKLYKNNSFLALEETEYKLKVEVDGFNNVREWDWKLLSTHTIKTLESKSSI